MSVRMQQVLAAWDLASDLSHGSRGGVTADAIAEAERILGRRLPRDVHDLYSAHDGGDFLRSNIQLFPLHPTVVDELAVASAGDLLRSWQWPIPPGLVLIGGDGGDEHFGLWLPSDGEAAPLAVQLGEDTDEAALAVVGDDLASFLAARSAYFLMWYATRGHVTGPALDALGVPTELRVIDPARLDDDAYDRLLGWASPGLPDPRPDPYGRRFTPEQVDTIARHRLREDARPVSRNTAPF